MMDASFFYQNVETQEITCAKNCGEENPLGCEHEQHGIEIKKEFALYQFGLVNKLFITCHSLIIDANKHSTVHKQINAKRFLFYTLPVGLWRKPCPFKKRSEQDIEI